MEVELRWTGRLSRQRTSTSCTRSNQLSVCVCVCVLTLGFYDCKHSALARSEVLMRLSQNPILNLCSQTKMQVESAVQLTRLMKLCC